nr:hypothetical protein [Salinispora pacifica]
MVRWLFRRCRRPAPLDATGPTTPYAACASAFHPKRPANLPAWMTQPTVANPQVGRVGWLTPAQQWRANGGRW